MGRGVYFVKFNDGPNYSVVGGYMFVFVNSHCSNSADV